MKGKKGFTLLEIIVAFLILSLTTYFFFQIFTVCFSHITKMKFKGQLFQLTQAKVEEILYDNAVAPTVGWISFPENPEFQFNIIVSEITVDSYFPGFKVKKVTVQTRGPMGKRYIPEYEFSLATILINETQNVSTTREDLWGEGLSQETDAK
jgi:prepilin-type N-terminal cleavage/methylation domain-containing protein